MYQHIWYQKLRQLNPKLRVCQFDNSRHLPGVYYTNEREIVDICATDKGWVPANPLFRTDGTMEKSGYRRVVFILLHMKLTTPQKVRKVFPGFFEYRSPMLSGARATSVHQQWSEMMKFERERLNILGDTPQVEVNDVIVDKMKKMEMDNFNSRNSAALSGDQFIELADDVKKNMTSKQLINLDKARFEYDKATGKRKSII